MFLKLKFGFEVHVNTVTVAKTPELLDFLKGCGYFMQWPGERIVIYCVNPSTNEYLTETDLKTLVDEHLINDLLRFAKVSI